MSREFRSRSIKFSVLMLAASWHRGLVTITSLCSLYLHITCNNCLSASRFYIVVSGFLSFQHLGNAASE